MEVSGKKKQRNIYHRSPNSRNDRRVCSSKTSCDSSRETSNDNQVSNSSKVTSSLRKEGKK